MELAHASRPSRRAPAWNDRLARIAHPTHTSAVRWLLTAPLILLFVVGFVAFFLLDAVLGYSTDTSAVVATAEAGRARETIVDLTEEFLFDEMSQHPDLAAMSRPELRRLIEGVISEAWFEKTLRSAHGLLRKAVDDAAADAVLDLRETKHDLRQAMAELQHRAGAECERLLGAAACLDDRQAQLVLAAYQAHAHRAIDRIPNQIDLIAEIEGRKAARTGSALLRQTRRAAGYVRLARWIGLGALAACLAAIALLNVWPLRRLPLAVGIALTLAAGAYLITASALRRPAREHLAETIAKERRRSGDLSRAQEIAADGAERLAFAMLDRATRESTTPVALLGLLGLGMCAGSVALRR
jgi:hypothetical protein